MIILLIKSNNIIFFYIIISIGVEMIGEPEARNAMSRTMSNYQSPYAKALGGMFWDRSTLQYRDEGYVKILSQDINHRNLLLPTMNQPLGTVKYCVSRAIIVVGA